ncbi:MAG: hypothetical protein LBH09_04500 [Peptococcaceae bacterium]|jgi:peptidoglycan/LPS O-acetylase OafA/YrhL|nr:hypothetical protein [Peptococcaceae bacterium]
MIKRKAMIINLRWILVVSGLISVLFGIVVNQALPENEHDLIMLMGMFVGLGSAFITVGIIGFVLNARMTPEQKRQEEIDRKDERNIMICGYAYKISSIATSVFFAVSSFVLVGLGNRLAAYFCIGGMYLQIITQALAQMYYQKKM